MFFTYILYPLSPPTQVIFETVSFADHKLIFSHSLFLIVHIFALSQCHLLM